MALIPACLILLSTAGAGHTASRAQERPEGKLSEATITVGPFDIHRRYRSMEGPYVIQRLRVGELFDSAGVSLPESMVKFVEGASAVKGAKAVEGLASCDGQKRNLYWFKGIKVEVVDENGKVMPSGEFICHLNLDVDVAERNKIFKEGEACRNARLVTLTQGQTEFRFPEGYGVPVASDESWTFTFQAANRTTDEHRRLKQRCTVSFIKDSDLVFPIKALNWYTPYITVVVDRGSEEASLAEHAAGPSCLGTSEGVSAPNSVPGSVIKDSLKRQLSGHWVVPPGKHFYSSPITEERESGFAKKDRKVHAVWSHVHPLCSKWSLVSCSGGRRSPVFTARARTTVKPGPQPGLIIETIEPIASKKGLDMPAGRRYELEATYDNTSGQPQDSMVALGIFFADETFARPSWTIAGNSEVYCNIRPAQGQGTDDSLAMMASAGGARPAQAGDDTPYAVAVLPPFQSEKDGPVLSGRKTIEIETSAGGMRIELDPEKAPFHATQLYKLLTGGAFNGTPLTRYEPNFVLQTAPAEQKVPGMPAMSDDQRKLLRRLPLEVDAQKPNALAHKKWTLTMARYEAKDSATSSFSVLLNDAPHLDGRYTVFGYLVADEPTLATIERITGDWSDGKVFIRSARDVSLAAGGH